MVYDMNSGPYSIVCPLCRAQEGEPCNLGLGARGSHVERTDAAKLKAPAPAPSALDRISVALERLVAIATDPRVERWLSGRERTPARMIKVTRVHPLTHVHPPPSYRTRCRLEEGRIALELPRGVGAKAMRGIYAIPHQPGLYRDPDGGIVNSADPHTIGVAPAALGHELQMVTPYTVRVRIEGNDPDAWDWHDWRVL